MSYRSQVLLGQIKSKTGLTPNITGRFAISLSLHDVSVPNPDEFDEKGSEILPHVLFGEYEDVFRALMIKRLQKDKLPIDSEMLNKMTRAHFNRGVIALFARVQDLSSFYEMIVPETK